MSEGWKWSSGHLEVCPSPIAMVYLWPICGGPNGPGGQRGIALSDLLANSRLAARKKRLGIGAMAAKFERAEVLEPRPIGHFRLRFNPETKLVEIVQTDLAVSH